MQKNEIIQLDARVQDVIANAVFRAQLDNGHVFVAFARPEHRETAAAIRPGDRIKVSLSPYDMSSGRITLDSELELDNES